MNKAGAGYVVLVLVIPGAGDYMVLVIPAAVD